MSNNRVIVTGGAGYIGSHTCKLLHKQGFLPIVIDNLARGNEGSVRWGDLIIEDLNNSASLGKIIRKIQPLAVIHFAAKAYVGESISKPADYFLSNVSGTISLLNACIDNGVKNFIFSSSCAVYGRSIGKNKINEDHPQNPISPYGLSKLMCEKIIKEYCRAYGMRCIIFRYFNASGADPEGEIGEQHDPETHLIPNLINAALGKNSEFTLFGNDYDTEDGTSIRDFIHVNDIADAHIKGLKKILMENFGFYDFYNLGSGSPYSILQILGKIESMLNQKINLIFEKRRVGDPEFLCCDYGKASQALGFYPHESDMDNILNTAIKWHINND